MPVAASRPEKRRKRRRKKKRRRRRKKRKRRRRMRRKTGRAKVKGVCPRSLWPRGGVSSEERKDMVRRIGREETVSGMKRWKSMRVQTQKMKKINPLFRYRRLWEFKPSSWVLKA